MSAAGGGGAGRRAGGVCSGGDGSWPRPRRHVAAHYLLRLIELPNLRETTNESVVRRRRRLSHGSNLLKIADMAARSIGARFGQEVARVPLRDR